MIAKGPAGGGVPKPGTPARAKLLAQHANNLTASNYVRQQKAEKALARMNLTPEEHLYVQSKVNQPKPPKNFSPRGYRPTKIGKDVGQNGLNLGGIVSAIGHGIEHRAIDAAQGNPFGSKILENIGSGHLPSGNSVRQDLEAGTSYQQLQHPGRDPLGAGLAAASILPFGRLGKAGEVVAKAASAANVAEDVAAKEGRVAKFVAGRQELKALRRGAERSPEAAHAHVLNAAVKAKQQGFGRILPKIPLLKPGEVTKETGGQAGAAVRAGLKNVGHERNVQEAARAVERSQRAGAIEGASQGVSGVARHIAAKTELQGQLPSSQFKGFDQVAPQVEDAINHIYDHPHFQPYEKVRAGDAILEGIKGKVPTKSDQKLLERAFGKEQAQGIMASIKSGSFGNKIANVAAVPRSIMASGDLSAPFRQGLVAMAARPDIFFGELPKMMHAAGSERYFQETMGAIHKMPEFPLMEKGNLALTDIGDTAKGVQNLSNREEQFVSNLAEQIPGIGHMIRGSDRAYVGFLNQTRARLFRLYVHQAAENGYHLTGKEGDKLVEDIGKVVNAMTGRGDLGGLNKHTAFLNAMFFSPRLLASRINFMNPYWYAKLSPFARQKALAAAMRLGGTITATLWFAKMAGASVNMDMRNADFGKIRIGNTRLDIAGGFAQPLRLAAQLYTGQIVSSTTGRLEPLGTGFGQKSRLSVLQQFLTNKLAPTPGAVVSLLGGNPLQGKITPQSMASNYLLPLLWQDVAQLYHSTGPGGAVGYGIPDLFGVGVQNYSAKPGGSRPTTPFSSTGSGSNPFSGSSSSGNPFP